jgi:hypothetical protein
MRNSQHILILLLLIEISCFGQNKTEINDEQSELEIEIISQIIPKLISPSPPPPPPSFTGTEKEIKQFNDSIKIQKERFDLRVDTTEFYLYITDSLFIPNKEWIGTLRETEFNGLAKFLLSEKLKAKPLNISSIDKQISYKVLPINRWKEKFNESFGYLGMASFSRIVFNKNYTQALFYFEHYYNSGSCSGHLIHVEKQSGIWIIIENDMIWTS